MENERIPREKEFVLKLKSYYVYWDKLSDNEIQIVVNKNNKDLNKLIGSFSHK